MPSSPAGTPDQPRDPASILRNLRSDPSLRFTEHGRDLLRWLDARTIAPVGWQAHADRPPAHCHYAVAELARSCARRWLESAERLESLIELTNQPGQAPT